MTRTPLKRLCCKNADAVVDFAPIQEEQRSFLPELDKRSRLQLEACNDSWRVDETSIKVKKTWLYLYRAVDSEGNTLEFVLSPTRDAQAAKRFARHRPGTSRWFSCSSQGDRAAKGESPRTEAPKAANSAPRVINLEKNAAYRKAIAELKASGILPEKVELTSWSSISTTSSSRIIGSSNASSSQGWASFRWKRLGERYKAMK